MGRGFCMKRFSNLFLAALLAVLAGGFSGCKPSAEQTAADEQVIKVGEYASLTGKEAAFGQSSHKGTLMAIEEINAQGGVLGKKLKLIYEDDQTKAGESATIAEKVISDDKVVALLGEVASGRSLEAAPICQQNRVPMISPSSTNPKVTEVGDYIFRVCFTDEFQGRLIANFALDTLKAKKIALMKDVALPYSVGLRDYFVKAYEARGGTILTEKNYSSNDKDFNAQLTAIKAENPEAIFVPGYYTEAGLIVAQARQLGITVPIFGGDGWEAPELIQLGGDAMEGTYFSTHYSAENQSPMVQDFVKKFQAKYNGETPDAMAALGYDSAMVLADAIKRAGTTDEPQLRDAIAATKDFEGVTGKTTLDANRNATKPAVIITVKDGKFKYVETINP
jgi:branched-chain amino acid transport system substrate-binding protein